jgi:hypothetical protein
MGASGTSGALLFQSEDGSERFIVTLGVHNYARWCDVVTGLVGHDTALTILPDYYDSKRSYMREKTLSQYSVTSAKGRKVEVKYTVADGHNLKADIIIG